MKALWISCISCS